MGNTPKTVLFYLPKEVAELFRVSLTSVYRWMYRGALDYIMLPGEKTRRITAESVERIKRGAFTVRKPSIDIEAVKDLKYRDRIAQIQLKELERSSK